jgi:U3 small nucleolar RNA-associated protein 14
LSNGTRKAEKPKNPFSTGLSNGTRKNQKAADAKINDADTPNPYLAKAKKGKKNDAPAEDDLLPFTNFADEDDQQLASKPSTKGETVDAFLQQRITATDDDGWATVLGGQDSDADGNLSDADGNLSDEGDDLDLTNLNRNHLLTAQGFAGDNVAADFTLEKADTTKADAAKETTDFLPGWGSWAGDGMTKAERRRNRGWKTVTQTPGIDANKRKDKNLDRVIINEKTVKPNKKYLAGSLPFPFENKEQYERSLRQPKGREWTTKKSHQEGTLPRVLVKGGVIQAMRKPMA